MRSGGRKGSEVRIPWLYSVGWNGNGRGERGIIRGYFCPLPCPSLTPHASAPADTTGGQTHLDRFSRESIQMCGPSWNALRGGYLGQLHHNTTPGEGRACWASPPRQPQPYSYHCHHDWCVASQGLSIASVALCCSSYIYNRICYFSQDVHICKKRKKNSYLHI